MSEGLKLEILTPLKTVYSGFITSLTVNLEDGELCVLRGHMPMLAMLPAGRARIRTGDDRVSSLNLGEGFLRVSGGDLAEIFAVTAEIE